MEPPVETGEAIAAHLSGNHRFCIHTDLVLYWGNCNLCCPFQKDAGLSVVRWCKTSQVDRYSESQCSRPAIVKFTFMQLSSIHILLLRNILGGNIGGNTLLT